MTQPITPVPGVADTGQFLKALWDGSPAQRCPASCYCPVPEVCRNLTPEQVEHERQIRLGSGIIERHTHRDGITVVDYVVPDG